LPPLVIPDIARDFVYVDDVTDAYLLAAARESTNLARYSTLAAAFRRHPADCRYSRQTLEGAG
jgi:nucleoside-diphosphate-sugar epimerase